jgi:hypothetical protein
MILLATLGCRDGDTGPAPDSEGKLVLAAEPANLSLTPGSRGVLIVTLSDDRGRAVPGRLVQVALLPAPAVASGTRGATLSAIEAATSDTGRASFDVFAGLPTSFFVRASAARADELSVPVAVVDATTGDVEIAPSLTGMRVGLAGVRLAHFLGLTCGALEAGTVPTAEVQISPTESWRLTDLDRGTPHAVLGRGQDGSGRIRWKGCVEIEGRLLGNAVAMRVLLPLAPHDPDPVGRFVLGTGYEPNPPPLAATQIAEAWSSLSSCPLDPAQLWLDCTIDAFSSADPDDCRPAADEGPRAAALRARLGMTAATPAAGCRGPKDAGGRQSLDAGAQRLFDQGGLVAELDVLAREASGLLESFRVTSTLAIEEPLREGRYRAEHTVDSVEFAVGLSAVSVNLLSLALPARTARFIRATPAPGEKLTFEAHAVTLRLGTAAREAFQKKALAARGIPTDENAFVARLMDEARFVLPAAILTGCPALDAFACAEVGSPAGCLLDACEKGLQTLARRLRAGFDALDGEDLDLTLEGEATVYDNDGDGIAEALGNLATNPATWEGELRSRAGATVLQGLWAGQRRR